MVSLLSLGSQSVGPLHEWSYYNIQGFTDCKNDAEVALVTIHAGRHNVYAKDDPVSSEPGTQGTIDTGQIAWDFLSKHSK